MTSSYPKVVYNFIRILFGNNFMIKFSQTDAIWCCCISFCFTVVQSLTYVFLLLHKIFVFIGLNISEIKCLYVIKLNRFAKENWYKHSMFSN